MQSDYRHDRTVLREFRSAARRLSIALLCGPKSLEDKFYFDALPFSQISSGFIHDILVDLGVRVKVVQNTAVDFEKQLVGVDAVFVNMHGEYGEDGSIQGFLDYLDIPYTGSGIYGSAIGINKLRFKKLVAPLGYSVPTWAPLSSFGEQVLADQLAQVGTPAMLKLVEGGSSIGMHMIAGVPDVARVCRRIRCSVYQASDYFLERRVTGREFSISILDLPRQRIALPILEIVADNPHGYDEVSKLRSQRGESVVSYLVPAKLPASMRSRMAAAALRIFGESECRGFGRLDLILEGEEPQFLELNTIPGLQKDSNFLMCARAAGLSPQEVILALLYDALHKRK